MEGTMVESRELTVYMSGMVFFDGCHSDQKQALLPNGSASEHYACIWYRSANVRPTASPQGESFEVRAHDSRGGDTGPLFEIIMRRPVGAIRFPDEHDAPAEFVNLENGLAKLKKKNTGDPFPVDPANADTIAIVPIRGGKLTATHHGGDGLVVWKIRGWEEVVLTIADGAYAFTFGEDASPELFLSNACGHDDAGAEDTHYQIYKRLNRAESSDIEKPEHPGPPESLSDFARDVLKELRKRGLGSGETPTCCR